MAGATALATMPSVSQAGTAEISLVHNHLDSVSGNSLSLEITAGHPFGTIAATDITQNGSQSHASVPTARVYAKMNLHGASVGVSAAAAHALQVLSSKEARFQTTFTVQLRGLVPRRLSGAGSTSQTVRSVSFSKHGAKQKAFGLIEFSLSDPNVLNRQTVDALLEIEAFNSSDADETVALLNVFYSTSGTAAPDLTIDDTTGAISGFYTNVGSSDDGVFTAAAIPEPSSLSLMALGAGGIVALRRRRKRGTTDRHG